MKKELRGADILQHLVARRIKERQEARLGPDSFINRHPNFFKEVKMEEYIGVKVINARPANRLEFETSKMNRTMQENHKLQNALAEGYIVEYPDGYVSWSPKETFEEAYRKTSGEMTFGLAIEAMKKGKKVSRRGWNGKGMYIYITPGTTGPRHHLRWETKDALSSEMGPTFTFNSHIDMKSADGTIVVGWLASQTDMLSEDWMIVE